MLVQAKNYTHQFPCELTVIHCGCCGGIYAINEKYRNDCWEKGTSWHCPYCERSWGYTNNGENARLKRELESKQRALEAKERLAKCLEEQRDAADRRTSAQRGLVTKIKKRVAAGVCPCCNRHFVDLHAHMDNKHPDFANP